MSDRWMDGGRTEKTEIAISANRGSQYKQILSSVQLDVILVFFLIIFIDHHTLHIHIGIISEHVLIRNIKKL